MYEAENEDNTGALKIKEAVCTNNISHQQRGPGYLVLS